MCLVTCTDSVHYNYIQVGSFRVVHQSPSRVLLPANGTIPLYCIVSHHTLEDVYEWRRGLDEEHVNTPVLWVKMPGAYSCRISRNGQVCKSTTIVVEWEEDDVSEGGMYSLLQHLCNTKGKAPKPQLLTVYIRTHTHTH